MPAADLSPKAAASFRIGANASGLTSRARLYFDGDGLPVQVFEDEVYLSAILAQALISRRLSR